MLVDVGRGGRERRHDLLVQRAHDLVQLAARPAHVVHLGLELLVPLLEHRQLLERQRVHRPERRQLALELVGVLRQRRVLRGLGLGKAGQLLGRGAQVPRDVLVQRLGPQVDLVHLEVEGTGAVAHRIEALLGRVAVLAQLLEALAAGAHRIDLVLVVVAQRLEDAVEAGVLLLDDAPRDGPAPPLRPPVVGAASPRWRALRRGRPDAARPRRGARPGRAGVRRRPPPGPRAPGAARPGAPGAPRAPATRRSASCRSGTAPASCACSAVTSASRCCAARTPARASSSSPRHPALLVARPLRVDPRRLDGGVVAVGRPLGRGTRVAGPGQHDAGLGQVRPGQLGARRPPPPPGCAPPRPRRR